MTDKLSPSEAISGFMAWLATREDQLTLSRHNDTAPAADLVKRFCELNDFEPVREGWQDLIKTPGLSE